MVAGLGASRTSAEHTPSAQCKRGMDDAANMEERLWRARTGSRERLGKSKIMGDGTKCSPRSSNRPSWDFSAQQAEFRSYLAEFSRTCNGFFAVGRRSIVRRARPPGSKIARNPDPKRTCIQLSPGYHLGVVVRRYAAGSRALSECSSP